MAQASAIAINQLARILRADTGLEAAISQIAAERTELSCLTVSDVLVGYTPADLLEKSAAIKYPSFHIYCERVTNKLTEKFRTFSGTVELIVEVRVSHEHVHELHPQLNAYAQAVTDVLDRNRGTWAAGLFYAGTYEITFQPVKRGGKNFIQSARIRVETHVSLD